MKKLVISLLVIFTLSLSVFSVSFLTPEAGVIEEGYIYTDTFNPAWGLRWGLFGFIETGVSQVNNGAYLKAGFNELNGVPVKFSLGYSNTFNYQSSIFSAIGYDSDFMYFDVGAIYYEETRWDESSSDNLIFRNYGAFAKTSVNIIKEDLSDSYLNLEGAIGFKDDFSVENYMVSFYGVQDFKNKIWIFDGLNLYAGLSFQNETSSSIVLIEDMNIVLGLSTRIKVF
ncbi:hypothetical protein [Petrotoga halophila]|uniref:Outer membrane protein beta-barrel domain-containing protein n=1 Tax=Petrotoga halophila DSM 16923 TaxID=1122953 RepID=A0A2S5ECM8_9BACT|nr:hypothetical protein [Petrotoga halophila]POZ90797.1 hypothetical protein AA81_10990 [Petrotoga halophila DSM 16923]